MSRNTNRVAALALAGVISVGGVVGAAGSALAATPRHATTQAAAHTVATTVTAKANRAAVGLWKPVVITGAAHPAHNGQVLYLQQEQRGHWVTLWNVHTNERRNGTYTLYFKSGQRGVNHLRLYKPAGAGQAAAVSNVVTVKVG
jgi:hypothetical protein